MVRGGWDSGKLLTNSQVLFSPLESIAMNKLFFAKNFATPSSLGEGWGE